MQGYDFALVGHLESWEQATRLMAHWRPAGQGVLTAEDIAPLYGWIPPREIFRIEAQSTALPGPVRGIYIETFIPPDSLGREAFYQNLDRVKKAMQKASRLGAGVVTLGGFTSILLEGRSDAAEGLPAAFTTGNSLTAALISKGVEAAAQSLGIDLAGAKMAVLGSTGDIGTAICRYFKGQVGALLLCARNRRRLELQQQELAGEQECRIMPDAVAALTQADVLVCVASTELPAFDLRHCKEGALICDAGYPKNILAHEHPVHLFWGGMGRLLGGARFQPDEMREVYHFPAADVGHGCLLESVLLAMEGRPEAYSKGRGNIRRAQVLEMWAMAQKHGIVPAPFMNGKGLWPDHLQVYAQP